MTKNTIIYSLNVKDIQDVAQNELDRKLKVNELKLVVEKIGNYLNWYDSIANAIIDLKLKK